MQSQLAQYFFLSLENCLPGAKATGKQICNSKLVTWLKSRERERYKKFYNQPPTRIQLTYDNAKVLTGKWPSYGGDRTDLCHCLSASVVTCFVRTRFLLQLVFNHNQVIIGIVFIDNKSHILNN
ncbi:Large ribosomal subunit protein [Trichinella spiralis]|uniref:Large ribosomal subunit protein n=1 Tax=Trichinella spiralis TaxID=6334 RepID=A0ABR3KHC5_TRISP